MQLATSCVAVHLFTYKKIRKKLVATNSDEPLHLALTAYA